MLHLYSAKVANDLFTKNFLFIGAILLIIGFLASLIGMYLDLKKWSRDRFQGGQEQWQRRPPFLYYLAMLFLFLGILFGIGVSAGVVPFNHLLYIAVYVVLLGAFLSLLYRSNRLRKLQEQS